MSLTTDFRLYKCTKCKNIYFVKTTDADIHLLKPSMRCPSTNCPGKISVKAITNLQADGKIMTAVSLYQASMGVGTTEERKCSPKDLIKTLVGSRIINVKAEQATDPNRSILTAITLEGGKTIHIATSTNGPMVFKITEE